MGCYHVLYVNPPSVLTLRQCGSHTVFGLGLPGAVVGAVNFCVNFDCHEVKKYLTFFFLR